MPSAIQEWIPGEAGVSDCLSEAAGCFTAFAALENGSKLVGTEGGELYYRYLDGWQACHYQGSPRYLRAIWGVKERFVLAFEGMDQRLNHSMLWEFHPEESRLIPMGVMSAENNRPVVPDLTMPMAACGLVVGANGTVLLGGSRGDCGVLYFLNEEMKTWYPVLNMEMPPIYALCAAEAIYAVTKDREHTWHLWCLTTGGRRTLSVLASFRMPNKHYTLAGQPAAYKGRLYLPFARRASTSLTDQTMEYVMVMDLVSGKAPECSLARAKMHEEEIRGVLVYRDQLYVSIQVTPRWDLSQNPFSVLLRLGQDDQWETAGKLTGTWDFHSSCGELYAYGGEAQAEVRRLEL